MVYSYFDLINNIEDFEKYLSFTINDGQNFIYFMTLFNTIEHNSKFI